MLVRRSSETSLFEKNPTFQWMFHWRDCDVRSSVWRGDHVWWNSPVVMTRADPNKPQSSTYSALMRLFSSTVRRSVSYSPRMRSPSGLFCFPRSRPTSKLQVRLRVAHRVQAATPVSPDAERRRKASQATRDLRQESQLENCFRRGTRSACIVQQLRLRGVERGGNIEKKREFSVEGEDRGEE